MQRFKTMSPQAKKKHAFKTMNDRLTRANTSNTDIYLTRADSCDADIYLNKIASLEASLVLTDFARCRY